nr:hypothetical protein [Actinomycetota bacterium]
MITTGTAQDPSVDATHPEGHDADAVRKISNRLRRAHGQLAAVIGAVEA